jgi:hypothetical protein
MDRLEEVLVRFNACGFTGAFCVSSGSTANGTVKVKQPLDARGATPEETSHNLVYSATIAED